MQDLLRAVALALLGLVGGAGCIEVKGGGGSGGSAGSGGTGSGGAGPASTGTGGGADCVPGSMVDCYTGPAGTENVGICHGGKKTCNPQGTAYGNCEGQVVPAAENCVTPADDDCDGLITETGCGAKPIAAGQYHSLARRSDGTLWAWGRNDKGQLGDGTTIDRATPVQVVNLTGIISVAAGDQHSVVARSDGTAHAWGNNSPGKLGDGTTTDSPIPVQVLNLTNVTAVAAGGFHSLALRSDGTAWSWGANNFGQLGWGFPGLPSYELTAGQIGFTCMVTSVDAGWGHSLAVCSDGTPWSGGYNVYGQAGNDTSLDLPFPEKVLKANPMYPGTYVDLTGVAVINRGGHHSLAVTADGTAWAWGQNTYGQLGTTQPYTHLAQPVDNLTGVTAIVGGYRHSLALLADGTIRAWGSNASGQLGNGTTSDSPSPVQVPTLTGAVALAAGDTHSLALLADGTVWAWGSNQFGQLGDGTTTDRMTPVQVLIP
jgi:alpha-tubulin suppressor-like RCC1 family protein